MAAADISRFTDDPDLKLQISTFLALLSGAPDYEKPAFVDADAMIDGLAFVAALLVEQSPEFTTPRHLRLGSEEFGRRTHEFVKAIRDQNERTGKPVMSAFAQEFHLIPKDPPGHA